MMPVKISSFALLWMAALLVCQHSLWAQQTPAYSKEVEARIKQVESSLGESIKTDNIPILLEQRMKLYNVSGVSIAVVKDFKLDWARGYGFANKEQKLPVTTQTLFQAASISKSLNAVGVLKLVQDKKITLDADINTYLTSWKFPYDSSKNKKPITIKHLLSHTAGTSVHGFRGYAVGEKIPELVQILNGEAPANNDPIRSMFEAGTKVQYSGGGTTILQQLVMDVTQQPYDQYQQKNVLDPLGMKNSFYTVPPPRPKADMLATGYKDDGKAVEGKFHLYPEQAAASLWTNPTDLSNYIIEMQLAYAGKSKKVLNQQMVSTMVTPVMGDAALGTFIRTAGNDKYFNHRGSNEGFRCIYIGSVEGGNGVAIMVNSDNGLIIEEIVNSVATVYNWKDFYKPVVRKVVRVSDQILDTYVGEYELTPDFKIVVTQADHALKIQATGQPAFDIFAESQDTFFVKAFEAQVTFFKDNSNKITKLVLKQNGRSSDAPKIK